MALIVREGGRTIPAALAEVREAVDYLRYYAMRARADFACPRSAAGPDRRAQRARVARPRRLRLHLAVEFPAGDLHRPDRGRARRRQRGRRQARRADAADRRRRGAAAARGRHPRRRAASAAGHRRGGRRALVADPRIAGVAFTGSTETARPINLELARRPGPIVPLIAETGGQNAMIVDFLGAARAGRRRRADLRFRQRRAALLVVARCSMSRPTSPTGCWRC